MRIALVVLLLALAGCSHTLHVISDPPGATVQVEGRDGRWLTPCDVNIGGLGNINDAGGVHIKLTKAGHATTDTVVRRTVPGWTISTVPFLGIPYPARTLDYPDGITVNLSQDDSGRFCATCGAKLSGGFCAACGARAK